MNRIILTGRNSSFPSLTVPPSRGVSMTRGHLAPSVSAMLSEGASPMYDATAEKWLIPPSSRTLDAGRAAALRGTQEATAQTHCSTPKAARPAAPQTAAGHLPGVTPIDIVTTAIGLLVFGMLAVFCLAMTMV